MSNNYNSIGYSGKIKISLAKGKKILKTAEYENNGSYKLFEFLGSCLQGDYVSAKDKRPVYIQGFDYYGPSGSIPQPNVAKKNPMRESTTDKVVQTTGRIRIAEKINYVNTKGIRDDNHDGLSADKTEIYYHFRIPAAQIFKTTTRLFCLYSGAQTADIDYSACFLLLKNNGEEWDPLVVENVADNYNLLIDWVMTIKNNVSNETSNSNN